MTSENPYRAAGTFSGPAYTERSADRELRRVARVEHLLRLGEAAALAVDLERLRAAARLIVGHEMQVPDAHKFGAERAMLGIVVALQFLPLLLFGAYAVPATWDRVRFDATAVPHLIDLARGAPDSSDAIVALRDGCLRLG